MLGWEAAWQVRGTEESSGAERREKWRQREETTPGQLEQEAGLCAHIDLPPVGSKLTRESEVDSGKALSL